MQFREAMRRDLEGERVRFEADRKRTREAATKELEAARVAEMERAALTVAGHERELREASTRAMFLGSPFPMLYFRALLSYGLAARVQGGGLEFGREVCGNG